MAVTSSGTATVTLPTDEQILITREFDAPKHLVYKAWTTPELVKRWWSAKRGEVTIAEIDLRVGGTWRYVMVTTEGGFEVAFHGEYREIVPNERIVSTEVYEGAPQAEGPEQGTLNTLTFTEADGRTMLTILVQARSEEIRDAI
ncbi:MAG: SRPBCC family protein, partial [Candidatus Limnocylindria bacterium]